MVGTLQFPMHRDLACWRGIPSDIRPSRLLASEKLVYFTSISEHLEILLFTTFSAVCATLAESILRMSCRVFVADSPTEPR